MSDTSNKATVLVPSAPRSYRPTTLRLAVKHCPAAMDLYHDGVEVDRRIFATGTAAHVMLQGLAEAANKVGRALSLEEAEPVTLAIGHRLIAEGRTFEGEPEAPLSPDAVWLARDLGLAWIEDHPIEAGASVEVGLAVDENWKPTPYGPGARLRLIVDWIETRTEEGEESSARILSVKDYKSAWPTDEGELGTVQMKAQAVLAHLHCAEDVDAIRITNVNLRTRQTFDREIWFAEDGGRTMRRWREELTATMEALDRRVGDDGRYIASPGGGCVGCPFIAHCAPGQAWRSRAIEGADEEERGRIYATLVAGVESLRSVLREELGERLLDVGGGRVLGTVASEQRTPREDAWRDLWNAWLDRATDQEAAGALREDGYVLGLLSRLGLGVAQIESAAKGMYKPRLEAAERREFVEGLMTTAVERRFGLHKVSEGA